MLPMLSIAQKKTVNLFKECYKIEGGALVQIGSPAEYFTELFRV